MFDAHVRAGHKSFTTSARGLAMLDRAATSTALPAQAAASATVWALAWAGPHMRQPHVCSERVAVVGFQCQFQLKFPPRQLGRPVMLDWSLLVEFSVLFGARRVGGAVKMGSGYGCLHGQRPMGAHWAAQQAVRSTCLDTRSLARSQTPAEQTTCVS